MGKARQVQNLNGDGSVKVTSILSDRQEYYRHDDSGGSFTIDDKTLNALGYKQEFKRDFSLWQSFAVSCSCLGLLPSIASTISYDFGYSGTGGAVWGWLVASIIIQSTAFSIAELCSSMPTEVFITQASAALAPAGWGPLASWFVGWSNFCGYVVAPCSLNYALASMLLTCAEIAYPNYVPRTWHLYLCTLALLFLTGLCAMQKTSIIGLLTVFGTAINIIAVFIFFIWFPVGSINHPKTNNSEAVWTTFRNGTEWPIGWATILALIVCICVARLWLLWQLQFKFIAHNSKGFLTVLWTMASFDAPFHVSEECANANIACPRAIVMTSQFALWLGWGVVMVMAYTVKDLSQVLSGRYDQPFGSLCLQVLGKKSGLAMLAISMVAQFFCALGLTIAGSRIVFAYSRDGAIPGSQWWSRIDSRTKTPVLATWAILTVDALLGLLMFAGSVAIGAVFTIGAIAQYTAFTAPIALKLFFGEKRFIQGPWNLGILSKPLNIVAIAWWFVIAPALCFPSVKGKHLSAATMNWTCLLYSGTMFLAMCWYGISARKWFKGPRINLDHIADGKSVFNSNGNDERGRSDLNMLETASA